MIIKKLNENEKEAIKAFLKIFHIINMDLEFFVKNSTGRSFAEEYKREVEEKIRKKTGWSKEEHSFFHNFATDLFFEKFLTDEEHENYFKTVIFAVEKENKEFVGELRRLVERMHDKKEDAVERGKINF